MDLLIRQLAAGLGNGAIYASLALALVFIFRSTGVINFAQGEMAMFSAYLGWQLVQWNVPLVLALMLAVLVALVGGIAVERTIIRPLHGKPELSIVAVTVGLLVFFNALAGLIWSFFTKRYPSPFPKEALSVGPVPSHIVGSLLLMVVVVGLFAVLLQKTKLGLAMRAAAVAPTSSRLVGIRVGWILALGWGIAAALGAISGILVAPMVLLEPNMMSGIMVYAFASAILGGMDSLVGAVVGGILVGISETLASTYIHFIGSELKILVPLAVIFVVLLLRPQGLFGRPTVARV
jgi:branched-chain amino acid transport system permease protein